MKRFFGFCAIIMVITLLAGCLGADRNNSSNVTDRSEATAEPSEIDEIPLLPTSSPSSDPSTDPPTPDNEKQNFIVLPSPVAVRDHCAAIKKDGTVVAVDITSNDNPSYCEVSDWRDIVQVDVGNFHTVGLKKDGTVLAVGQNDKGQCDVSAWEDITAITASLSATFGLKKDGTVVTTHSDFDLSSWDNIIAIDAGDFHIVGLKDDGTVLAVGSNDKGQCNVSTWTGIKMISAGRDYTAGLQEDGGVIGSGYGRVAFSSEDSTVFFDYLDIVSISTSTYTAGLTKDGRIAIYGLLENEKSESWDDVIAIAAGDMALIGVKEDGSLQVTGYSLYYAPFVEKILEWENIGLPDI
ncbi:MAG: RCC1 domain-containing protein [Caldicoprobacterales bacterium]